MNTFPGPVHTARHAMEVTCTGNPQKGRMCGWRLGRSRNKVPLPEGGGGSPPFFSFLSQGSLNTFLIFQRAHSSAGKSVPLIRVRSPVRVRMGPQRGDVAQWESARFAPGRARVQIPSSPLTFWLEKFYLKFEKVR